jgi:hypothetical protein
VHVPLFPHIFLHPACATPTSGTAMRNGGHEQNEGTDCETTRTKCCSKNANKSASSPRPASQRAQPANQQVPHHGSLHMGRNTQHNQFRILLSLPRRGQASTINAHPIVILVPLHETEEVGVLRRPDLLLPPSSWLARRQLGN